MEIKFVMKSIYKNAISLNDSMFFNFWFFYDIDYVFANTKQGNKKFSPMVRRISKKNSKSYYRHVRWMYIFRLHICIRTKKKEQMLTYNQNLQRVKLITMRPSKNLYWRSWSKLCLHWIVEQNAYGFDNKKIENWEHDNTGYSISPYSINMDMKKNL